MGMIDPMLMEFEHEMSSGRKMLEIVPEAHWGFKPHPKSMPLGSLAAHLAEIPGWATVTINQDEFAFDTSQKPVRPTRTRDVLQLFDQNVAAAKAAMKGARDEQLMRMWALKVDGKTVFSMPKIAVLRSFVFSHFIHHRAQLGVYLRLKDIPLPQVWPDGRRGEPVTFVQAGVN